MHRLYSDFLKVKSRLANYQFVCWIAGGAVRDFCLNREVKEFDLVTDATTENLKLLFPEAILVGESFGVLKIPLENNEFFDLTTFRQESDYLDGRRPSHVSAATPVRDSERRDFTINALFWDDVQNIIIDYKAGLFDLVNKRLICVGDPEIRFSEDFLRILRLVRFSAQLKFEIEPSTNDAAYKLRSKINQISGERVWSELTKIDHSSSWAFAFKQKLFLSLLVEIFETEEISKTIHFPIGAHIFLVVYLMNPNKDFSELLKSRLKISNRDLKIYQSIFYIMNHLNKLSVEYWAYTLDKSPFDREQFNYLTQVGLIPQELNLNISRILSENREPLLIAQDLVALIPNRYISEELKFIRLNQLSNIYKTKEQCLNYLKQKYKDKSENT